jgi:hypothetical protein
MLQCARCRDSGHACAATHEDIDGRPCCAFCLDSVECPVSRKQRRSAGQGKTLEAGKRAPSGSVERRVRSSSSEQSKSGVTTMQTPEPDPTSTPKKICARPGCTVELSSSNTCGRCRAHVRWQDRTKSAGNEHAAASSNGARAPANGSATKANSNGHAATPAGSNGAAAVLPELAADRVDQLLATLTAGDKARLALAWLRGEL